MAAEGFRLLAWREVPTDGRVLGPSAARSVPAIVQLFVAPGSPPPGGKPPAADPLWLERRLYVIRKQAEKAFRNLDLPAGETAYFASFSSRTIVYKGLLLPEQLPCLGFGGRTV